VSKRAILRVNRFANALQPVDDDGARVSHTEVS
jgi:hypothetical protein